MTSTRLHWCCGKTTSIQEDRLSNELASASYRKNSTCVPFRRQLPSFKQHAGTVHTASKMTLIERKLASALMAVAARHEELVKLERQQRSIDRCNFEAAPSPYYNIALRELCELSGVTGTNNWEPVKNALRALVIKPVEFNVLNNAGNEEWRVFAWVSEVIITEGQVRFAFPPSLAEKVRNPSMWTLNQLAITTQFDSKYAHALYMNCQRFRALRSTGEIAVTTWRRLLDATESSYDEFRNLRRRVFDVAINEVNEKSDIVVKADWVKSSRRVLAVRFSIEEKRKKPKSTGTSSVEIEQESLDDEERKLVSPAMAALLDIGVTKNVAATMVDEDPVRALQIVEYATKLDRRCGVRTNIAGLIVTLFRSGFEPAGSRYSASKQADLVQQAQALEQARRDQDINSAAAKERRNRALDRIAASDDSEIDRWVNEFCEQPEVRVQPTSFDRDLRAFPHKVDQVRFVTFMQLRED